ncbi:MAG TPA: ATP-binding protein [Candidatus Ozemobacteraceae bacterium]
MSIRVKIGIGFALMIVALTGLIITWGARTLGLQIEAADLGKLTSLRETTLARWERERASLASISAEIAPVLVSAGLTEEGASGDSGSERLLETVELLKRQLSLDWLDIRRNGQSLLYPLVRPAPLDRDHAVPQRISLAGPLAGTGLLTHVTMLSTGTELLVARKPASASMILAVLWDRHGMLYGDPELWSPALVAEYAAREATFQRLMQGRLYRLRATAVPGTGQMLLVGYEADSATLTRTGVDELMLRLALLEILGLLILGYFLGRHLFGPLERLKQAIDRVGAGHWQEIPPAELPDGEDEIGMLGRSFNHMVRELSTARDRLIEVQRELMSKEKMAVLGRFSAGLAHEINNPLGTILASAGLAADALERGRPVEADDIRAIIEETRRCRRIVESLLEYAHNRPPRLEPTSISDVIYGALRFSRTEPPWRGIELETDMPSGLHVLVDRTGIDQVLANLLRNAAEALQANIEAGAPAVIRIGAHRLDGEFAAVTVADNGPGLGEAADHLFEPLMTTKQQGTGLGLAICQSIIEGHGGRIRAVRLPEGRTEFSFTLRLVDTDERRVP